MAKRVGNTKRARNWFFTLNNYTTEHLTQLPKEFERCGAKFLFQEECGDSGTIHLQGVVSFTQSCRLQTVKKYAPTAHWEICRSKKHAMLYCMKAHTKIGEIRTNITDLPTPDPVIRDPLSGLTLHSWQLKLKSLLEGSPPSRSVYWIWESAGNTGKTSFAFSQCLNFPTEVLYVTGKAADVRYALASSKIKTWRVILWDLTRSQENRVSWEGIESLKNGIFFNGKYESGMFMMNPPWVVCFANFPPDMSKLSQDRWRIHEITNLDLPMIMWDDEPVPDENLEELFLC